MKSSVILLGFVAFLKLSVNSYAANATWSEEMNADPDPARWGRCSGEAAPSPYGACTSSKFPQADAFRNAITETGGIWEFAGDVGGDISHGMGVIDGPLGTSRPSPIAGAAQFTVEFKFRSTTPLGDMLDQAAPAAWNFPVAVSSDSTGNVPWTFKYGLRATEEDGPKVTIDLGMNAAGGGDNNSSVTDETVPYDDGWHVVRVIQDYTGNQETGSPTSGYMDIYFDGLLLKEAPSDLHTFNLALANIEGPIGAKVARNRTFYIHQDNQGSGSSSLPFQMDYLRTVNSIVPIGEALNAPSVGGCVGNLNGDNTTDGADVAIVYNNWATNNAQADINKDGTVDGADLAEVYNCWGQ
ncbi:MAG: hypothetical protein O2931_07330, partial [Planctomycetota bacterium]|nr:hypothetical protein [Planctomycetota bacterium]